MRPREHLVLCGGIESGERGSARALQLRLHGPAANVQLRIQDLSTPLVANIPDQLLDLLEVATYVFAADAAISRGGKTDSQLGSYWRRALQAEDTGSLPGALGVEAGVVGARRDAGVPFRRRLHL